MLEPIKDKLHRIPGLDEDKITGLIEGILKKGINGYGPLSSASDLASEYLNDKRFGSKNEMVDSLIKWEISKNFGSGFLTSMGGAVTLPLSISSSLAASWIFQARLAATIAIINGYSPDEDRVRTFILLSVLGDAGKEVLKEAGVTVSNRIALSAIKSIPGSVLKQINSAVGFRLVTKAGEKGVVNLTKVAPIAGGLVGGFIDSLSCFIVGRSAKRIFSTVDPVMESVYNIVLSASQISDIVTANSGDIKYIDIPEDNVISIKPSGFPLSVKLRLLEYSRGVLKFQSDGNFILKGLTNMGIERAVDGLSSDYSRTLFFKNNTLIINLPHLLESTQDIKNIHIEDIVISKRGVGILLK